MTSLISFAFVILIFIVGSSIVLTIGNDIISLEMSGAKITDTEHLLNRINSEIRQVASEGVGATRTMAIKPQSIIEIIPEEDSLLSEIKAGTSVSQYFSALSQGELKKISGNDVTCTDTLDLALENSFIRAVFRKTGSPSTATPLNSSNLLQSVTVKPLGTTITIADSSIEINKNASSVNGTGYTEILRKGNNMPSCTVHVYMNSTFEYDAYYTLYAGMDFLVFETRSIRRK